MLTREKVQQATEQAVRDYGSDWIDPAAPAGVCRYTYRWKGKTRHCLAGYILKTLGIDIPGLDSSKNDSSVPYLITDPILDNMEVGVIADLKDLQNYQDEGKSWGKCYALAYPDSEFTRELVASDPTLFDD